MNRVNQIVFSKTVWGDRLWEVVSKQLQILMENEEVCTIYDDDKDVIVIKFEHDERKDYWGCTNPYWLTRKQVEWLESLNNTEEKED